MAFERVESSSILFYMCSKKCNIQIDLRTLATFDLHVTCRSHAIRRAILTFVRDGLDGVIRGVIYDGLHDGFICDGPHSVVRT